MHKQKLATTSDTICSFIQRTFSEQNVDHAVIALSGGIDSALAMTLLVKALGPEQVTAALLPYGNQDMTDAHSLCDFNAIHPANRVTIDIQPIVDQISLQRSVSNTDRLRRGNIMARVRMILVYDIAREKAALVCGTENKSEHFLGYFTRFGDAASDIEPISQLYKTHVRELAACLQLPDRILTKAPSAGLWTDQTDEAELGFTYAQADQILTELIDSNTPPDAIRLENIPQRTVTAVCDRVKQQSFKRVVPYTME